MPTSTIQCHHLATAYLTDLLDRPMRDVGSLGKELPQRDGSRCCIGTLLLGGTNHRGLNLNGVVSHGC